jgi:ribonuclease HI
MEEKRLENINKKEVKNQDLWFKIDETINEIQSKNTMLSFEHVLGHNGEKYNERVDQLCTSFATGKPLDLYDGSIEGHNELLG